MLRRRARLRQAQHPRYLGDAAPHRELRGRLPRLQPPRVLHPDCRASLRRSRGADAAPAGHHGPESAHEGALRLRLRGALHARGGRPGHALEHRAGLALAGRPGERDRAADRQPAQRVLAVGLQLCDIVLVLKEKVLDLLLVHLDLHLVPFLHLLH